MSTDIGTDADRDDMLDVDAAGSAHPAILALRAAIASLAGGSPMQERAVLAAALHEVREARLDAASGFAAVLAADHAWRPYALDLSRRYRRDPAVAGEDPARFLAQMAAIELLFSDLYAGFAGLPSGAAGPLADETLLQALARTLFHLGRHAKWQACRREPRDAAFWRRAHAAYALAAGRGIEASLLILYEDKDAIFTCRQLWLCLAMLATVDASALSPRQIGRADQWLLHWCADVDTAPEDAVPAPLYCADLAGESGPAPAAEAPGMAKPVRLRTAELHAAVALARQGLLDGSQDADLGAYATNPLPEYLPLLDELQRAWTAPALAFHGRMSLRNEARPGAGAEVVPGIAQVLSMADAAPAAPERWRILEHSAQGLGLAAGGGQTPAIRDVVALRREGAEDWVLAVVVRVAGSADGKEHHAGVRVLANEAVAVTLAEIPGLAPSPAAWRAFFLAVDERRGQADSLLCASGTLAAQMRLSLSTRSHRFVVLVDRAIEEGEGWQRFGFQVLEKRSAGADTKPGLLPRRIGSPPAA